MNHPEPIPLNWCEDTPPRNSEQPTREDNANSVRHLEKLLAVVVRLVGEVLRDHQPLLDDFNAGLRLIRQQYFPVPGTS